MRRGFFTLIAIVGSLAVFAGPAAAVTPANASATRTLNRGVSGPFTGTAVFQYNESGCTLVHQVFDATYTTARTTTDCSKTMTAYIETINGTATLSPAAARNITSKTM